MLRSLTNSIAYIIALYKKLSQLNKFIHIKVLKYLYFIRKLISGYNNISNYIF